MSVLDEIRNRPYEPDRGRGLLHGMPGTGKTTLAASIAKAPAVDEMLFVYVPGEEGINSLEGLEHRDKITPHRLTSIDEVWEIYWALLKDDHNFGAVGWDSVSALQTMWKKHLLGIPLDEPYQGDPKDTTYAFWGALRDEFTDFFTFWYGLASSSNERPLHIIMTSQTAMLEDATGTTKMQPDLHKGPLSAAVSRADYILYTHMRPTSDLSGEEHAVRLKPSSDIIAKTRGQAGQLPAVTDSITLPGYFKALGVSGL